eukprot:g17780.t1
MGVVDVYLGHRFDDDSKQKKLSGIIVTISTMLGMWAFKSLLPLITQSIDGLDSKSLSSMEHFLLFQMMAAKLLEKILPFAAANNVPAVAFFGWPLLPILPRPDAKILTYVGPGIDMPHIEQPTQEDVDHWHKVYTEGLQKLFDEKKAGYPKAELKIF